MGRAAGLHTFLRPLCASKCILYVPRLYTQVPGPKRAVFAILKSHVYDPVTFIPALAISLHSATE